MAPLAAALRAEAGRLDCAGNGGASYAAGNCRFTPDADFTQMLEARGIGRPTREEAFGLMAVDARRDVLGGPAADGRPGTLRALPSRPGTRQTFVDAVTG